MPSIAEADMPAGASALKDKIMSLVPPVMVAGVIAFWAYAPKAVLENGWTLTVLTSSITLFLLLLERVAERHAGWRMNRREFFTDLFYVVLTATVISWTAQLVAEEPLRALKASLGIATPGIAALPFLAQVALVVVIIEFGQYWMHRVMHNWTPLWLTHAPHHHLTQLNAAKGAVGNPIELLLISLSVVALLDFDIPALLAGYTVLHVVSSFAHANIKANPPIWYSFVFTTIRHHSLHHSTDYDSTRSNYGNSLILLDRIFGTYREGEGVVVGQDERKRLSIVEQAMFPFVPLLDKYKARRAGQVAAAESQGERSAPDPVGSLAA
jgi:sterol desaturase/sphingolipid hydroxylase (fatty acid hydroxylase superfamily)